MAGSPATGVSAVPWSPRVFWGLLLALTLLHIVLAALLPISGDEAYYWDCSRHPEWSTFDQPSLVIWSMIPFRAVLGESRVAVRGPAILASNHLAVADSFYLPLVVSRRITFLAKAEYFTGTGVKGWFTRWFYTVAGQVPIDRTDADSAQSALTTAARILGEG